MYTDGTSAMQMLENAFEVLEGGGEVPAGGISELMADNGETFAEVTHHNLNAANGNASQVSEVVAVAPGAAAGTATGAGIFTMEVGAAGAAIAPALGILAGVGLYNLNPEFWTGVSDALFNAGKTKNGKVLGFVDKNGVTGFDEETIEIFKRAFITSGVYEGKTEPMDIPSTLRIPKSELPTPSELLPRVLSFYNEIATFFGYDSEAMARDINNLFTYINNSSGCLLSFDMYAGFRAVPFSRISTDYVEFTITQYDGRKSLIFDYPFDRYEPNWYEHWAINWGTTTSLTIDDNNFVNNQVTPVSNVTDENIPGTAINATYFSPLINCYPSSNIQPGATLPTNDPFPLTYPEWLPVEFPETLPASMPDVYPLALPTPDITQDPSQAGANETDPQLDQLLKLLYDIAPNIIPSVTPDVDPYSPPVPEPVPQPEPAPNPADPNPSPTPSGVTITLPTLDTTRASRMFTVYNPTDAELGSLGGFLWNSSIIEQIKKMWQNPLDGIISFHKVYCAPTVGSSKHIVLGYLDSEVSALEVTSQFADVDCGTVHIPERLHNATDYSPFTALHCYLPFIGIVELDTDECMNADLHIKYRIDVYTGTCVALLYLQRTVDMPNEQIIYTFSGNASQKLPLTAADFSGAVGALLGLAGAGVAVASGGSLGVAAGALGAAHSLTSEMVHIQHSGGLSANAGILSPRKPYIILSRQYGYDANAYNSFYGYPANVTVYIGNCTGFIKCKEVMFMGSCTEEEMNEIAALLKEGVYV